MPGGLFSRRKRKSELDTVFGVHVPSDVLAGTQDRQPFDTMPIEFIFVATRGDNLNQAADALTVAVEQLREGRWMIISMMGSMVMAARGTPVDQAGSVDRQLLADRVAAALGQKAKLIHGQREARVGDLGSAARRSYGVLIPDQLDLLAALHQAPWGAAVTAASS
jgi:hypothetical protein